jgi:hypothetical protein
MEDAEAGEMNIEKRDGFDACPIYVKAEVDPSHPLW